MTNYRQTMSQALEYMHFVKETNVLERELTDKELKRREEIAKELDDQEFKDRYGKDWMQVKMGTATKMAKAEGLDEKADVSLKKKAEKSGISASILKQVYNRGVAAWRTGHRPGTTPEQWGHARVNSFISKSSGTWGGADKDLAAKAKGQKEEVELDESEFSAMAYGKKDQRFVVKPRDTKGMKGKQDKFKMYVVKLDNKGNEREIIKDLGTHVSIDRAIGFAKNKGIIEKVELDEGVIDKVKQVASKKQAMKIDGVMVDTFTASAISQIYDKVNDANKKKMDSLPITKLANLAMKMMQKNEFVPEEVELDEDGHTDVSSAVRKCMTITEDAQDISSKLRTMSPEDSLPSWWTNKLAIASNDMNKMRDYIVNPVQEELELDEVFNGTKKDIRKIARATDNALRKRSAQIQKMLKSKTNEKGRGLTDFEFDHISDEGDAIAAELAYRKKGGKDPISDDIPPHLKKFVNEEVELDERMKLPRQLIDTNKEVMLVKKNKVIVVDKKDQDKYMKQGWILAEEVGLDEGKMQDVWQKKNAKSLSVGPFELLRGKSGVHTIKRSGKVIGDFSYDSDADNFVANIKGMKGQFVGDDIDSLFTHLQKVHKEDAELVGVAKKLKKASQAHAGQADKIMKHVKDMQKESAAADARRAMRRDPEMRQRAFSKDDSATDDDKKAASKNIMVQMRKAQSLRGKFDVEFQDGKKVKIPAKMAIAVQQKYNSMRKPADKEKFQAKVAKSYKDMLTALKEGFASDAQRKAAFASGYKEKGKKNKKESVLDRIDKKLKEIKNG